MSDNLDWFKFFYKDFLLGTLEMTSSQVGGYVLLLCEQWDKGAITSDKNKLRRLAKVTAKDLEIILEKFTEHGDNTLINYRMEFERNKAVGKVETNRRNGKQGGRPPENNNPKITERFTKNNPTKTQREGEEERELEGEGEEERKLQPFQPPPNLTHADFANQLLSENGSLDKESIEVQTRQFITTEVLKLFHANLKTQEKVHKTFAEYKQHLTNWVTKRPVIKVESKPKSKPFNSQD